MGRPFGASILTRLSVSDILGAGLHAVRLRTKLLLAMLTTLLLGDVLGTWIVQDRLQAGAEREVANQAQARARQVQSLYAERALANLR